MRYSISKEGVSLDQRIREKILKVSAHINKELESVLGLVNFYKCYVT